MKKIIFYISFLAVIFFGCNDKSKEVVKTTDSVITKNVEVEKNEQKVIEGIGKLKLGSSPSVLSEIGYDLNKVIRVDNKMTYFEKVYGNYKGNNIYQLFPDKKDNNGISEATYHPSVKVYYIPKYKPIEGIVCVGITLKYFDDSLYYIEIDNPKELEDAFELKYGKPEILKKVYGYSTQTNKTYKTGDPEITCYSTLEISSDTRIHYLILYNVMKDVLVNNYDRKIEEQQKEEKLKGLDGL